MVFRERAFRGVVAFSDRGAQQITDGRNDGEQAMMILASLALFCVFRRRVVTPPAGIQPVAPRRSAEPGFQHERAAKLIPRQAFAVTPFAKQSTVSNIITTG